MNSLHDLKEKHKNGRSAQQMAAGKFKQQPATLLRPDLFLTLLRDFQQQLACTNIVQPSNLLSA